MTTKCWFMISRINSNSHIVFDLDDTLYREIDYLKSAYRYICRQVETKNDRALFDKMWERYQRSENVFEWLVESFENSKPTVTMGQLLELYQTHLPDIKTDTSVKKFLDYLRARDISTGLITDGRSITQRNKLKALGLQNYFKDVIISEEFGSEKPDERNFLFFENKYPGKDFVFVGDNTSKDFIVPKKLGWFTICLKDCGNNIHKQELPNAAVDKTIESFEELLSMN